MGSGYLPDDLTPSDMKSADGASSPNSEVIRIVQPPAPPYDREFDIRCRSLNTFARVFSGQRPNQFQAETLLTFFEKYLRGGPNDQGTSTGTS